MFWMMAGGFLVLLLWWGRPVQAMEGFEDSFDSPQLHPRWQWSVPVAGPLATPQNGKLRLFLPQREKGFNHWTGPEGRDAPLLLTPVAGNWRFEGEVTLVDYGPQSNFHIALVAAFSPRYVLAWGPFYGPLLYPMSSPEVWLEPTGQGRFLAVPGEARQVLLRIEKVGLTFRFALKRPGQAEWTTAGSYEALFEPEFVGVLGKTFGNGPAVTAELDNLRLEPLEDTPPPPEPITIQVDARQPVGPFSRHQYGHFIEHLNRCIYGGIWAEMLNNRKFTGEVGPEGVIQGWQALGLREGVTFARDNEETYNGQQSQRITVRQAGEECGIVQGGIALQPQAYRIRVVLKQRGLQGLVVVSLRQGSTIYAQRAIPRLGAEWEAHEFTLKVDQIDPQAQLSITTVGAGTLWIGAASLMPGDHIEGFRRDVLEATRALRPPNLRWPGGNFVSGYHWRDGLGDRDRRPPRWDRAWGAWEWNDVGTEEFLRFCELVGAEPYICVNLGEGSPEEAAAWVEYCNGGPDTPGGRLRAANGHPEPHHVKLWGLGNEMYGRWQLGHLDATKYALKAVEAARLMKAVDPTIQLVLVGVEADGWDHWNRTVTAIAGSQVDYLAVHFYQGIDVTDDPRWQYLTAVSAPVRVEQMLAETARIVQEAHPAGRPLPLAFDEWNVWLNTSHAGTGHEADYTLRDGLFAAGIFHALHRLGDRVPIANLAQLVNVLGAMRTNATALVRSPIYLAFQLYSENTGPQRLRTVVRGGRCSSAPGAGNNGLPLIDAVATSSEDGETVYLAVINRHPTQALQALIQLQGFLPPVAVTAVQLAGEHFEQANTFAEPDRVRLTEQRLLWQEAQQYTYPPHSVTLWRLGPSAVSSSP